MRKPGRAAVYLIMVCVFLLIANVTLGLVLSRQSGAAMRTLINSRMLDVSNTAAAMLDGDMLEVLQAEDQDAPAYQSVLKTLTYFRDNIDLAYIYCIRDMGNRNFVFSIDPSDDPGEFGTPVVSTEALYRASLGTPAVDSEPYEDAWGRFYSAYSPVFNSDGKVAGIVAVDFSAEWYDQQLANHLRTTLLISLMSFVFAGIIIALVAARFRNRFRLMIREMNVVSDGIETLVLEASPGAERVSPAPAHSPSGDEIAELGNRIQSLELQLSERIAYVRSQAYTDVLTGVGNRTAYEDRVRRINDEIGAGAQPFAVALFDVNGLKEINDLRGHKQGDRAISEMAETLKRIFEGEEIYRIGGDEFVVILGTACADPESRLNEVRRIVSENGTVGVATGYAVFSPENDMGYRDVFMRADNAMYEDKRQYYKGLRDRRKNRRS